MAAPFSIYSTAASNLNKKTMTAIPSAGEAKYDLSYYLKGALAGGICCSVTHGALCPVDVVKTRIQLKPELYTGGMLDTAKIIIKEEGVAGLATGLGPTAVGYFVQGWFKFGGVEFFKINIAGSLGEQKVPNDVVLPRDN